MTMSASADESWLNRPFPETVREIRPAADELVWHAPDQYSHPHGQAVALCGAQEGPLDIITENLDGVECSSCISEMWERGWLL